jgi:hypothetical protein
MRIAFESAEINHTHLPDDAVNLTPLAFRPVACGFGRDIIDFFRINK